MKKATILFLVTILYFSCQSTEKKQCLPVIQETFEKLDIDGRFESFISSYIEENSSCENYYLYIYNNSLYITTKISTTNIYPPEQIASLFTMKYQGKNIFIYTGLEDNLRSDELSVEEKIDAQKVNTTWTLIFDCEQNSRDSIYLYKDTIRCNNEILNCRNYKNTLDITTNSLFSNTDCTLNIDSRLDSVLTSYLQELKNDIGDDINNCALVLGLFYSGADYTKGKFIISQTQIDKNLFKKAKDSPLFYINYKGYKFYLYIGLEFLIWSDGKKTALPSEYPQKSYRGKTWSCDLSQEKIRIYKSDTTYGEGDWNRDDDGYNVGEVMPQTWVTYSTDNVEY